MAKGIESLLGAPGGTSEKEEAAQDLIDAVNGKDAKAVALAFSTLYELCASGHGEEESEEPDGDEEVYGG